MRRFPAQEGSGFELCRNSGVSVTAFLFRLINLQYKLVSLRESELSVTFFYFPSRVPLRTILLRSRMMTERTRAFKALRFDEEKVTRHPRYPDVTGWSICVVRRISTLNPGLSRAAGAEKFSAILAFPTFSAYYLSTVSLYASSLSLSLSLYVRHFSICLVLELFNFHG